MNSTASFAGRGTRAASLCEAIFALLGFELLGEFVLSTLYVPIPRPVIGMLLLPFCLAVRGHGSEATAVAGPSPLDQTVRDRFKCDHALALFLRAIHVLGSRKCANLKRLRSKWPGENSLC
jgi:hypothetical protein